MDRGRTDGAGPVFASLETAAEYALERDLPEGGFRVKRTGDGYLLEEKDEKQTTEEAGGRRNAD